MGKEGDPLRYLGALAHALKAPTAAILLWADILEARADDPPTRARAIEAIRQGVKSGARLVDLLTDLSRCLAGSLTIDKELLAIPPLVERAVAAAALAAQAREVTIVAKIDRAVGTVAGDGARLGQVLGALLTRAIATSPKGAEVEIEAERSGGWARLQVRDHGRGIRADRLDHALDGAGDERGGLLLELALVRPLVALHGGRVEVASGGPGRATTFTVLLPRVGRSAASAEPSRARASRTARRAPRR